MSGFKTFEFNLSQALLEQVVTALDGLEAELLTSDAIAKIPEAQGVYKLFLDRTLVYIGKTDAEAGLHQRLERHWRRIQHRNGLEDARVTFKALQVYVFAAMDLETQLISAYRSRGQDPAWNGSGFGNNDPGRNRETTNQAPDGFDANYPLNIDRAEIALEPGTYRVAAVLSRVRATLPYTLRYETERGASGRANPYRPHPDLQGTNITMPASIGPLTTRRLLQLILAALPKGWQATSFPSHVILYKEDQEYLHGTRI